MYLKDPPRKLSKNPNKMCKTNYKKKEKTLIFTDVPINTAFLFVGGINEHKDIKNDETPKIEAELKSTKLSNYNPPKLGLATINLFYIPFIKIIFKLLKILFYFLLDFEENRILLLLLHHHIKITK